MREMKSGILLATMRFGMFSRHEAIPSVLPELHFVVSVNLSTTYG